MSAPARILGHARSEVSPPAEVFADHPGRFILQPRSLIQIAGTFHSKDAHLIRFNPMAKELPHFTNSVEFHCSLQKCGPTIEDQVGG
jgi:hypothetical protein